MKGCALDSADSYHGHARHRGRPPKLSPEDVEALVGLVRKAPALSLEDIVAAFRRQRGITLSVPTVHRYLLAEGFRFDRRRRAAARSASAESDARSEPAAKRYGYRQAHRDAGASAQYPCGLTDSEWQQVQHLFDPPGRTGRPEKYTRRQMLEACVYVLRSGCSWRMLPRDFPPWPAVYKTFRRWSARGLFEEMYDELRRLWRSRQHRAPDPTAAVIDSQSVKTSPQGGPTGYDAGKKVKGRKRHIVTDTLGLLIAVLITVGSVQDRDAALPAMDLAKTKAPGIKTLYVDGGYAGARAEELRTRRDIKVEVVRRPSNRKVGGWQQGQLSLLEPLKPFVVLPRRWVVERTNAWNQRPRRMNRDHDRNLSVSTAWIWLTEGRMLLRRVTTGESAVHT